MLFILKVWFTSSRVIVILMLFILRKYKLIKPDNYLKLCKTTTAHEPHNSFPHFRQKKKLLLRVVYVQRSLGMHTAYFEYLYWKIPLYWFFYFCTGKNFCAGKYFCTGRHLCTGKYNQCTAINIFVPENKLLY